MAPQPLTQVRKSSKLPKEVKEANEPRLKIYSGPHRTEFREKLPKTAYQMKIYLSGEELEKARQSGQPTYKLV